MTQPSADTRTRLVEAARFLFGERGDAATGPAEILRRARANSGSFHTSSTAGTRCSARCSTPTWTLEPHLIAPVRAAARRPIDEVLDCNAQLLTQLRQRFISRRVDWSKFK